MATMKARHLGIATPPKTKHGNSAHITGKLATDAPQGTSETEIPAWFTDQLKGLHEIELKRLALCLNFMDSSRCAQAAGESFISSLIEEFAINGCLDPAKARQHFEDFEGDFRLQIQIAKSITDTNLSRYLA